MSHSCLSCFKKRDGLTDAVLWQAIDVKTSVSLQKVENIACFKETAVMNPLCSTGKWPLAVQLQTTSLLE